MLGSPGSVYFIVVTRQHTLFSFCLFFTLSFLLTPTPVIWPKVLVQPRLANPWTTVM